MKIGTKVESVYTDRIRGTVIGFAVIQDHMLDVEGDPIEFDGEFSHAVVIRLDTPIGNLGVTAYVRTAVVRINALMEVKPTLQERPKTKN